MEYDIKQYFKSQPAITIRATDNQNDIESFIREKLTSDARWNSLDRELREEAQSTLFAKSDGMFQWANLQVQELLRIKHLSNKAISECLRNLPATLDETYGSIWEKINKQNPTDRKIGRRAIKWALCMKQNLSAMKWVFAKAISIDDETESLYDIDEAPSVRVIEGACYNLLVHNPELERWQFCHLSAAEYMESTVMSELQPHRDAAIACLKYLLDGVGSESPPPYGLFTPSAFLSYADRKWNCHLKYYLDGSAGKHPQLEHLIERFLGSATQSSRMYRAWADRMANTFLLDLQPSSLSLFAIVHFGLLRVLEDWYDHDPSIDLDVQTVHGYSLIGLAARALHLDICQFLVAKGVNIEAGTQSPLSILCVSRPSIKSLLPSGLKSIPLDNHTEMDDKLKEIATFLIDNGADVNTRDKLGWTPLDTALITSKKDVISMLVKHNAEIGDFTGSLLNAAKLGNPDWIRYCLDSGAAINEIWDHRRSSLLFRQTKRIKMLLDAGLDVNYIPRNGDPLLNRAAKYGNLDSISLLIKAGANPNPKGVEKGPIYQAAASNFFRGSEPIKKLFQSGAAVNPPEGVSPLVGACYCGIELRRRNPSYRPDDALCRSKLLLDLGADPNHVRHFESPLLSAARLGNKALFQLFLKAGADPNSKNGFENALVLASRRLPNSARRWLENDEPVLTFAQGPGSALDRRWLLDAGADPTLTFAQGPGSALAFAAFTGNVDACSFLLDPELGVDVNAKLHGWFENVLLAAVTPAYDTNLWAHKTEETISKIISLLFEAGANILIPIYKTPPPSPPAINVRGREYLISSARATYCFSRHWLSIFWDIGSSPRPHVPLSMALRRYKLPSSIPPSASILIKLTSISTPLCVEYAGIFIFSDTSTYFIFDKNKSKFEHFRGFQTTQNAILEDTGKSCEKTQNAILEDTGKSCEETFPLTSSIKPLFNRIIGLALFIRFVLYLVYALLPSE
jgi:ankyrin repeat protein